MKILIDSDSVIQQRKQNGSEEDFQEDHKISYDKNEANTVFNEKVAKKLNKTLVNHS